MPYNGGEHTDPGTELSRRGRYDRPIALVVATPPDLPPPPAPLVCLDAGHSVHPPRGTEPIGPGATIRKAKDSGGAPGEVVVVLEIAKKTRTALVARGYRVAMTRTGPDFTYGGRGNADRARFCNRLGAALMLRIHADGSTDPRRHGISTLYPAWRRDWTDDVYSPSLRAARIVQRELVAATGALSRGLSRRRDLTGFNWANVPVVLAETGFMSNARERRLLRSPAYQWRLARGLARAATRFTTG